MHVLTAGTRQGLKLPCAFHVPLLAFQNMEFKFKITVSGSIYSQVT